jgi:hypothetical protein
VLENLRQTRSADRLPHSCRCGSRWAGKLTSHCGSCHRTFSGVGAFDRHRRGGVCLDPTGAGMALLSGRAYDAWGFPTTESDEDG